MGRMYGHEIPQLICYLSIQLCMVKDFYEYK